METSQPSDSKGEFTPSFSPDVIRPDYIAASEPYFTESTVTLEEYRHIKAEVDKVYDAMDGRKDAVGYVSGLFVTPETPDDIEAPGPHRRHIKTNVWRMIFGRRRGGGRHR